MAAEIIFKNSYRIEVPDAVLKLLHDQTTQKRDVPEWIGFINPADEVVYLFQISEITYIRKI